MRKKSNETKAGILIKKWREKYKKKENKRKIK